MKKFVSKGVIYILIISVVIGSYCKFAAVSGVKYNGANTAEQIQMSFTNAIAQPYNCYFLGNSRIYRNINPDKFTSVNSYNFAHDNDSYNQTYYKLLYLLNHHAKIEYLILGTDYFQFSFLTDSRNYAYSTLLPKEYADDYEEKSWFAESTAYIETLWTNKQNCLGACLKYLRGEEAPEHVSYQKDNGQYVVTGIATGDETIDRDYTMLDIQLNYFKKIIELCEEYGIELYVVMPPLWASGAWNPYR